MAGSSGDAILRSLNKAQCRAVTSEASTVAILAGPGSGKTHTLTSRVVWLVDHVGYQPCDIIVATFTVKAAREMKERIGKALGHGREKKIVLGTFHSIARRYLAAYGQRIGLDQKFGIADDSDSRSIIQRICKRLDASIDPPVARAWISKRKAKGTSDETPAVKTKKGQSVESQAFETCFQEYQAQLERSNLLDYDDLLVRCVELLREHPSCVSNVQSVLIDEYQDTNGIQYDLMKLFAQRARRITIVGDPDQSIYGWRSAEIRNLHRMLRDFPQTDEISLEENYRSSKSIVDVSLQVIQQDEDRYKKVLLPVRDKGSRPVLRRLKNPVSEGEWIISEIKRIRMMSGDMITFDDIAILLRSASLSRHIESALGKEGIAYKMVGGFKFYERAEIKTILDYLRIIHQPDNNDALARVINVPKRGIGDTTIKSLLEEAETSSISLWNLLLKHCRGIRTAKTTIRKDAEQKLSGKLMKPLMTLRTKWQDQSEESAMSLTELIEQLLRDIQFEKYLEDTYGPESESRWGNVQEFVNLAAEFMRDQKTAEDDLLPTIDDVSQVQETDVLARFLANVSLASDIQKDDQSDEPKPMVTVSTIHAAKGLEWPVVFIPAVYKGSIPHMRSDDDAEERRLLYVAMTRAKALLYLSCPSSSSHGNGEGLELSPFIKDISSSAFLKKGPCFDRHIMEQIAHIIMRQLPTEGEIYQKMPPMAPVEDNLFPIDPNERQQSTTSFGAPGPQYKRQKTHHTGGLGVVVDRERIEGWNTPYATTMENTSGFTLSGFTTAGAYHAAHPKVPEPEPESRKKAVPRGGKKPSAPRPPAQRSLLGYMGNNIAKVEEPPAALAPPLWQQTNAAGQRFQRPSHAYARRAAHPVRAPPTAAIDASLKDHKLGAATLASKPAARKPTEPREQYTCFSSSPAKPSADHDDAAKEDIPPAEPPDRPASSFHRTTVGDNNGPKAFRKPPGLGREGIAPLNRLTKPFKPLTINRQ